MIRNFNHALLASAAIGLAGAGFASLNGCDTFEHNRTGAAVQPIEFSIQPSSRSIVAGEIVTVTTRSANTLGRNTSVEWTTTGGDLSTEQNKRIARVRFDQPGTYTISAVLRVDDNVVKSDAVDVVVKPLMR